MFRKSCAMLIASLSITSIPLFGESLKSLGKLELKHTSSGRFKTSMVLANEKTRLRLDCTDGSKIKNQTSNTTLHIISPLTGRHEIFVNTFDFYCLSQMALIRGLKIGSSLEVILDISKEKQAFTEEENYEIVKIKDVQFKIAGEDKVRSLAAAGGATVDFTSLEPVD